MEEEERLHTIRRDSSSMSPKNRLLLKLLLLFIWNGSVVSVIGEESQSPPKFISHPTAGSIVNEGGTKILRCEAEGNPKPTFKWLKDGHEISEFIPECYYKIHPARREDAGYYQCIARNKIGSLLSQTVNVTIAYMDKFTNLPNQEVIVDYGQAAVLNLPSIESHPRPAVAWETEDNTVVLEKDEYITSIPDKLIILSVSKEHEKMYRAHAINTQIAKESYSPLIKLTVSDIYPFRDVDPRIIVGPQSMNVIDGKSNAELHCIVNTKNRFMTLETFWLKDGIPVENYDFPYSIDMWKRTLTLQNVSPAHAGNYTCDVRSKKTSVLRADAQVNVLEPPRISNIGRETLEDYNSVVKLACDATGKPTPNIYWYKNSVDVSKITHHKRYFTEGGNTLVIKNLRAEDSGMFQCVAMNEAGMDTIAYWLKVKSSVPVMEIPPKNVTVFDGIDVTLNCRVAGAPIPNITWLYYDTQPVLQTGRFQYLEEGDLLIKGARTSDSGKYTCSRVNEAGAVEASAYVVVRVKTQISQPPSDTRVLLGQDALLQCKITGDPAVPYQVDWFHNNRLIGYENQRIKIGNDGTLTITSARPTDVGEYKCFLQSSSGNDTRVAKLNVIELPYSPTSVRAERIDHRSVNLSWAHAFDGNSPIVKYIIQKREVPELSTILDPLLNWVTELSNVSASVNSVILTNLKAASSYQFRISAVNGVGEGSPSDASNPVQLPQEPPSGPPTNFAGSARSSSEIITQWQPPLEDVRNGRILGYMIRYKLYGYDSAPWTTKNITNESQRNYLIEQLITWKEYVLQIAAYNEKGIGVFSEEVKVKTKEGVPETRPEGVTVKSLNSTSVQVRWEPLHPQHINGVNQGYKIQAWRGETLYREIAVPPNLIDSFASLMAVMSNLEKYTEYNITVLCFTDLGGGPSSQPVPVRTDEDVPDEISDLQFQNISDRSVTLVWNPPKHVNGILKGFSISYAIKDKPDTIKSENLTEHATQIRINNLMPSTHYKFEVFAWSQVGPGPTKIAVIQSGVEPVLPHCPTKLAVTNIEAFSVVLQFTPGFDGNSSIIRWIVEAQTRRNVSWFPIYEESNPEATTLKVNNLIPFTTYKLRLIAVNVVGPSEPSESTKEFQTIQAPPAHPPWNVTVRAMSATQLRVRWTPLQQAEWFGNARGYNASFKGMFVGNGGQEREIFPYTLTIEDPTSNSYILDNLEEYTQYEIVMIAFNDVGFSQPSPPAIERTKESVPSSGPTSVTANATSSTTIVVRWGDIPIESRNGQIEGFKVYYGAFSRSSHPLLFKDIPNNYTFTTTLTELRKYSQYSIQVLAYTRLGDGVLSSPQTRVQTFDDTPGPPTNVSCPDVTLTSARIRWDEPEDPNGEILAYRVDYRSQSSGSRNYSKEFDPLDRTYQTSNLEPEQYYFFSVTAKTRLGWGKTAQVVVYTISNREHPQPPSTPVISSSQVQANQITFSWVPGSDGFAPLRYYTIQKSENFGVWITIPQRVDPAVTSFTATDLKPYTNYRFRVQATNDIGPSPYSQESREVRTFPAAPSKGIENVKVVPITTTSVLVQWSPLAEQYWSGDRDTGGYTVLFQPVSDYPVSLELTPTQKVHDTKTSEVILSDLMRDRNYEIVVIPFNSQGNGPLSRPITVYVGEAVPTGSPRNVEAESISGTEVRLKWLPPQQNQQNGDLLGYKIFYFVLESPQEEDRTIEEEIEVVPATYNSYNLIFLDKYTKYRIQILAFNPAGDGPRSDSVIVKTQQGIPGPPSELKFSEITMNSLVVSWQPPKKINGELVGYVVTYETAGQNESFSKQVKQKVSETKLFIQTLEEEVTYVFIVRALTIDYGPPIKNNVTTGPQEGSPSRPRDLSVARSVSSFEIRWTNGASGKGPILGYYVQSRKRDDNRWMTVFRTDNGPLEEFSVSYQSLLPSTHYQFRVISYNEYGVSYPVTADEPLSTPSKLYYEYGYLKMTPFYHQSWFMVALAAGSIIVIIVVVAILCIKSKSYKYKKEAQKSLEESLAMDIDDRHRLAMELYRSRRLSSSTLNRPAGAGSSSGTLSKRNTVNRKSQLPPNIPPMVSKSPPRPSPASVVYHSDEESLKDYDENPDDSSLTEKASELSSSESQASESENESLRSDPHSFVNHYANVNDSLRQSWKRQKPVRNYSSYTDSEPEGSAVVSLNGGQIVMNNMARSRAPLPGFSSFV